MDDAAAAPQPAGPSVPSVMDASALQSMLSTLMGQIQSGLQHQVKAGIQSQLAVPQKHLLR